MNLIESKVIQTQFESEIFVDADSNVEIIDIELPQENLNPYKILIGLDLIRIRNNKHYGTKTEYFGVEFSHNMEKISLFETKKQSIFSLKSPQEKKAVKELIVYILTVSPTFKKKKQILMKKLKESNVKTVNEIIEVKEKLTLLEKLDDLFDQAVILS